MTVPRCQALKTPGTSVTMSAAVEQLVALGVGLHQAVLDAVVHHLGEVAGADLAGVHEASSRGPSGRSASKTGSTRSTSLASPPTIRP